MQRTIAFKRSSTNGVDVASLLRPFVPRIGLHIERDHFVWRRGDQELRLRTIVQLDSSESRVLGVGDEPLGEPHVTVALFPLDRDGYDHLRDRLLETFVRAGFERVLGRMFTIRPHVHVSGIQQLSSVLRGYEAPVVADAILRAGAAVVTLDPR